MVKIKEYKFNKDKISLFRCETVKEIEENIEDIFKNNKKILPKNKNAKILVKPNFNNDLNALTGNSTDLRLIIPVLKSLKKRGYKNIILGDGPNCGVNHIGINVFSRLCLDKVAKMFDVRLLNLNDDQGKSINLITGKADVAKVSLDADFIINLPKLKTHMEAKITVSCKNYMGCLKGVNKREMHENLARNIVRLNEIIKTDLIIVDGLICMEGNGPGDGIPKKMNIILEGHNPYVMDLLCSKLIGLDYKKIPFLKFALKEGHLTQTDEEFMKKIQKIANFIAARQNIFSKILLYKNYCINIRFMKPFRKIFDSGFVPWFLFKLGVRQDIYIHEELDIKKLYPISDMGKIKKCLEAYCPVGCKKLGDKNCLKCMYCYQIAPDSIGFKGKLNAFKMQMNRFSKYLKKW
tara:strand:- start:38954 stop:40174 length:1221 start_codon:yes stop_codon:yes gene_type:complete